MDEESNPTIETELKGICSDCDYKCSGTKFVVNLCISGHLKITNYRHAVYAEVESDEKRKTKVDEETDETVYTETIEQALKRIADAKAEEAKPGRLTVRYKDGTAFELEHLSFKKAPYYLKYAFLTTNQVLSIDWHEYPEVLE